ncbi:MAG: circadian clock protein KaiC [Methanomethylovorans sp. PtaU1.Bin073]|jgi:KaiC/GvpD/RAD55 family RecA-like ATPase|nr:MAG: circadian clock protein KaiC [Methanomethylovorans sp. PtaU1.Bin073]
MDRVPTGIVNLDKKIGGGYPRGKGILLTGVPGSGKTIFGLHLLYQSCSDGKKCVLIATEESPEDLLEQAGMLGMRLEPFLEKGLLTIKQVLEIRAGAVARAAHLIDGFNNTEIDLIEECNLDRSFRHDQVGFNIGEMDLVDVIKLVPEGTDILVVDNLGVLAFGLDIKQFRDKFDTLNRILSSNKITVVYVMDDAAYQITHQIADYSTHGAIKLFIKENPYTGKMERFLNIPKMRSTSISLDSILFEITASGIELKGSKGKIVDMS